MSLEQRAEARSRTHAYPPGLPPIRVPGRRLVTPQMVRARAETAQMPRAIVSKGQVRAALRRVAPAIGLSHAELTLMLYLVSLTYDCDWAPGALLLVGPSNERLGHELGLSTSQIRNLLRRLAERGLIDFHDSPTQARRIRRTGRNGPIVHGYGIDLSPLAHRHASLTETWAAGEETFREVRALRAEIMSAWKALCSDAACALATVTVCDEIAAAYAAGQALIAERDVSREPAHLRGLASRMHALADTVSRCVETLFSVDTATAVATGCEPIQTTNLNPLAKATAERRSAPHAQEASSSRSSVPPRANPSGTAAVEPNQIGPIGGFPATPGFVLKIAPQFRSWVGSAKPRPEDVVEAASYVTGELGISRHAWETACNLLGRWTAAVAVAVVANRHAAGLVKSPGGYLRGMLEQHRSGELRLDRSLFGIADTLPGGRGKPS